MLTLHEVDDHEVHPLSGKRADEGARVRSMHRARPVCAGCQDRPAVTRVRGRYVVLEDHDLCRQCWRAHMDAGRATQRSRRALHERRR